MPFSRRHRASSSPQTHSRAPKPAAHSSWNQVAHWYADHLSHAGTYHETLIFPGTLRLLRPKPGKRYLDIACGEGSFLRLLRQKDASLELYGVDAAPSLLAHASSLARADKKIHVQVADAQQVSRAFPPQSFDGATCLMALQNIERIDRVFAEAAKLLVTRAPFVVVINHPCFRAPQQSGWGWDEARKLQYRRMDRYLTPYTQPIVVHPGSAPTLKTLSYHRPLSAYLNELIIAGFHIDAIEEWTSDKVSTSGPRAKAENQARAEFPLFLAIRATRR